MIRNIIWDVDGTLFDTYPAISKAFQCAVRDLGGDAPLDWIMETARISLGRCVEGLAIRCHVPEEAVGRKFDEYYEQIQPAAQPPFPGVIQICQSIRARGGKNVIVSHRERKGVGELLEAHHMGAYFSGWITRDDGYPKKPDPAAFEVVLQRYQLIKEETLAVGDRDIDILAGQAAGVLSCLFDPASGPSTGDLTIRSYEDLSIYLEQDGAADPR
jgi:HAD superfamily hydrolase (TIGR01509 family)